MKEKLKTVYICSECGETYHKWQGQCSACKAWNTLEEDVVVQTPKSVAGTKAVTLISANAIEFQALDDVDADDNHIRIKTGIGELDRVLGGGIVRGAGMLIGGEPGAALYGSIGAGTVCLAGRMGCSICSNMDAAHCHHDFSCGCDSHRICLHHLLWCHGRYEGPDHRIVQLPGSDYCSDSVCCITA